MLRRKKKLVKLLGPMPSFQKAVFLWNQHALRKKLLRTSTLFQQRTKALFWHKNAQMKFLLWQHKVMKNIRLWLQFVSKKVLLWKQKMSPISVFVALQLQLTLSNKNIFLRVRSFHFHQSARAILESRDFKRTPQKKKKGPESCNVPYNPARATYHWNYMNPRNSRKFSVQKELSFTQKYIQSHHGLFPTNPSKL